MRKLLLVAALVSALMMPLGHAIACLMHHETTRASHDEHHEHGPQAMSVADCFQQVLTAIPGPLVEVPVTGLPMLALVGLVLLVAISHAPARVPLARPPDDRLRRSLQARMLIETTGRRRI